VHNEAELAEAFSQLHSFTENFRGQIREPIWLLEEYMDGEEVSVEAWTLDGKTTVLGITDKSLTGFPYFIEDGHMFPADLDEQQAQAIEDYLVAVLRAVGHDHGVSHTEIKLTAQGLRVVEINSRPAGNFIAELIEHVTGFNLLDIHINLALGIGPQLQAPIQRQGSAAITFFVPPTEGIGREMTGLESLDHNPQLVRWQFKPVKDMKINSPIDNACYLGHVIARDTNGRRARHYAEQALQQLSLHYREGSDNKLITEDV
jgi:biotin carboxylase